MSIDSRLTLPGTDLIGATTDSSPASSLGHLDRDQGLQPTDGRWLDPLGPAPPEQLVADQFGASLRLAHASGQPLRQVLHVGHRAPAEAELPPNLYPVVLDRVAQPPVEPEIRRLHADPRGHGSTTPPGNSRRSRGNRRPRHATVPRCRSGHRARTGHLAEPSGP